MRLLYDPWEKKKKKKNDHGGGLSGFGKSSPVGNCWRMTQLSGSTFQTGLGKLETDQH